MRLAVAALLAVAVVALAACGGPPAVDPAEGCRGHGGVKLLIPSKTEDDKVVNRHVACNDGTIVTLRPGTGE